MLKKVNASYHKKLELDRSDEFSVAASNNQSESNLGILEEYFSKYEKVTIDQPFQIFNEKVLADKSNPNLDVTKGGVDYGVLSLLEGDWYSYIEDDSKRVSNIKDGEFKPNFGSGVHTTIMPSPGTTQNNIPGKFSFECDEYIEKLSFDLVPGGIRNRGGANEQFCGAVKYEQSIIGLVTDKLYEELLIGLQNEYTNKKIDLINKGYNSKRDRIGHIKDYLNISLEDFLNELETVNNKNYYLNKIIDKLDVSSCKTDLEKSVIVLLNNLLKLLKDTNEKKSFFVTTDSKDKQMSVKDFLLNKEKYFTPIHEENGMYLWLSDVLKNPASKESIEKDRGVHNWDNDKGKAVLFKKLYGTDEKIDILQKELNNLLDKNHIKNFNELKEFIDISTKNNIKKIEKILDDCKSFDELIQTLGINKLLIYIEDLTICKKILIILTKLCILSYYKSIQINELSEIVRAHPFLDATLYNVGSLFIPRYVIDKPTDLSTIKSIVPAKELQPGEGIDRPTFVPDYSISRSGVIPHGSTITLLGDLKREAGSFLINGEPMFVNPTIGTWDKEHLALSDTMGTGISPTNQSRPYDLYNPPLPFTPTADFNEENDPGEEEVYTQQLFLHNLYPYSLRPDLRLRDTIKNQNIKNHIKVVMFSKKDEGAQGGIVNIPFVNRFVPTVNMKMNMWLETVVELVKDDKGEVIKDEEGVVVTKEILQLQYEQIVFFEFGFGDGGGTTSWPHIQVNTLRQYKDLNKYSKELANQQFIQPEQEALRKKVEKQQELKIAEAGKCPFGHTSKK